MGARCRKPVTPPVPEAAPPAEVLVALARARPVPPLLRSRFNVKLKSKALDISGSTNGGLVLSRPGRGRLDVMTPLGSVVISLLMDGTDVDLLVARRKTDFHGEDAEGDLRRLTGGMGGLDDLLGVLVGDLPMDDADVTRTTVLPDGRIEVLIEGPEEASILAVLDPVHGTPTHVDVQYGDEDFALSADYGAFVVVDEKGSLLPEEVTLTLPFLDMTTQLKFKGWKILDEVEDEVFVAQVPKGYEVVPLDEALKTAAETVESESP